MRNIALMQIHDVKIYRKSGEWQNELFDENLSDNNLPFMTELMLLSSRIWNDDARTLVDQFHSSAKSVMISKSEKDSERLMIVTADIHQALIRQIRQIIREMDNAPF